MRNQVLASLMVGLVINASVVGCSAPPADEPASETSAGLTAVLPQTKLVDVNKPVGMSALTKHLEAPGMGVTNVDTTDDGLRITFGDGVVLNAKGDQTSQVVTDAAGKVVYSMTSKGNNVFELTYNGASFPVTSATTAGELNDFLVPFAKVDMHPVAAVTELVRYAVKQEGTGQGSKTASVDANELHPRVIPLVIWGAIIVGGAIIGTSVVVTGINWTVNDQATANAQCLALQTGSGSSAAISNYLGKVDNAGLIWMIGSTQIAAGTTNPPLPWVCLQQAGQMTVQQNGTIVSGSANGYDRFGDSTNGYTYQLVAGSATISYPTGWFGLGSGGSVTCSNIPMATPFPSACVIPITAQTPADKATFCSNAALAGVSCVSSGFPLQTGTIAIR